MRVTENEQMTIGEVDISKIRFDPVAAKLNVQ
jgi:hypothetical protein